MGSNSALGTLAELASSGPGGFGPLIFAYPVQLQNQRTTPRGCILAHALGGFSLCFAKPYPTGPGGEVTANWLPTN
ncbi:hypothetical protein MLAC_22070 [Mycobacterium lacus]|uniref:Uncharacterized protein n=1 Tax=Mycobacterium lacus TaxID=169765 RepID=A0A7I7NKQ1_9MYCO|nr:hypothetical protein MLAC_22070 [Mycobacterium lacus]